MATIGVRKREEHKKGAPAYIVSFSGLMTILLTFFILLCTMANEQEYGLVGAGTGSFVHNINAFGLPGLLPGHRTTVDLGRGRPQFSPPQRSMEETKGTSADLLYRRVIAVEPIRLPRALAQHFKKHKELRLSLNVEFEPGSADLTSAARKYLWPLLTRIRMVPYHVGIEAHVGESFKFSEEYGGPWQLSAARAAAIVRYFHDVGGMSYRRMRPVGHGSAKPLVKSVMRMRSRVNDRIQLVILKR